MLPEPLGGAHRDLPTTAATLKKAFARHLAALGKMTPEELLQARYTKFRCMGEWEDTALSRAAQTASEKTPRKPKS